MCAEEATPHRPEVDYSPFTQWLSDVIWLDFNLGEMAEVWFELTRWEHLKETKGNLYVLMSSYDDPDLVVMADRDAN